MDNNLIIILLLCVLYFIIRNNNVNHFDNDYSDYVIVCAKYTKNTDFLESIPIQSIVLTKNIDVPNKANEATSYLYYIINNYDNLPNNIVFIHDEDESWHHEGKITENIYKWIDEYEKNNRSYYEINNRYFNLSRPKKMQKNIYNMFKIYWDYIFESPINVYHNSPSTKRACCAQFIVSKEVIRKRSIDFYNKIYNWLIENSNENGNKKDHRSDEYSGYYMGMYLEWTWGNIFNPDQ
jgi:hypothetical protein